MINKTKPWIARFAIAPTAWVWRETLSALMKSSSVFMLSLDVITLLTVSWQWKINNGEWEEIRQNEISITKRERRKGREGGFWHDTSRVFKIYLWQTMQITVSLFVPWQDKKISKRASIHVQWCYYGQHIVQFLLE